MQQGILTLGRSTARMALMPGHLACDGLAGIVEIMTLGFAGDRGTDVTITVRLPCNTSCHLHDPL
jgi:hypothetical protein